MPYSKKLKISITAVVTTFFVVVPGAVIVAGVGYGLYQWWKKEP